MSRTMLEKTFVWHIKKSFTLEKGMWIADSILRAGVLQICSSCSLSLPAHQMRKLAETANKYFCGWNAGLWWKEVPLTKSLYLSIILFTQYVFWPRPTAGNTLVLMLLHI